jgi:DNA-binding NtrC family response regulator
VRLTPDQTASENAAGASQPETLWALNTFKGETTMSEILVLDDVMDAGVMIKRILGRKGHSVIVFTEEQDALDHVRNTPVDIAILDIKLKKISGVEVLKEMKKISPKTDILMLTGYPTLETAREALDLGAREYLVKPIDKAELESKIDSVLKDRESS